MARAAFFRHLMENVFTASLLALGMTQRDRTCCDRLRSSVILLWRTPERNRRCLHCGCESIQVQCFLLPFPPPPPRQVWLDGVAEPPALPAVPRRSALAAAMVGTAAGVASLGMPASAGALDLHQAFSVSEGHLLSQTPLRWAECRFFDVETRRLVKVCRPAQISAF